MKKNLVFISMALSINQCCIFFLQTVDDARELLKTIDDDLGVPLPEKDYGGNCLIYDPGKPDDPFHNVMVSPETQSIITMGIQKCQ